MLQLSSPNLMLNSQPEIVHFIKKKNISYDNIKK